MNELHDAASRIIALARGLGADEALASVSRGVSTDLSLRDGEIEKAQESRSLSASVSLYVDGRYSSHQTSDMRPDALQAFLARAVDATRFLEADPNRRLPDRADMGEAEVELDLVDPTPPAAEDGRARLLDLEAVVRDAAADLRVRSVQAWLWRGRYESVRHTSHGFSASSETTRFGHGATLSIEDTDGRLPEAYSGYQATHASDLLGPPELAADLAQRARERLGSGPVDSGTYPLLLSNRVVSRVLGALTGGLDGTAIYERRSFLLEKLGERIAAEGFSLYDDPLRPRGLASRRYDGDGLPAVRRAIIEDGRLQSWLINTYNARRLGRPVTTGSTSNLLIPAGVRSPEAIVQSLPRVIRVDSFLGGNTNAATGDFSFGIQGALFEGGAKVASLSEMNVSGNLLRLFEAWSEAADDVWTYGTLFSPSLLFSDVQFSGR